MARTVVFERSSPSPSIQTSIPSQIYGLDKHKLAHRKEHEYGLACPPRSLLPPQRLYYLWVSVNDEKNSRTFVIWRELHSRERIQVLAALCEQIVPATKSILVEDTQTPWCSLPNQATFVLVVEEVQSIVCPYLTHLLDIFLEGHLKKHTSDDDTPSREKTLTSPCAWIITSLIIFSFFFRSRS